MVKTLPQVAVVPGPTETLTIRRADPSEPAVAELIETHFALMRSQSPEESCHVLPAAALAGPGITMMALCDGASVLAIGAIAQCDGYSELKSMHTRQSLRGRGLARRLLRGLLDEARAQSATKVCLETGAQDEHLAARTLYASEGFEICGPFGDYSADPLSVFMSRAI